MEQGTRPPRPGATPASPGQHCAVPLSSTTQLRKLGPMATPGELKRRFERNVPDLYREVLRQSDSLLLSREQVGVAERLRRKGRGAAA